MGKDLSKTFEKNFLILSDFIWNESTTLATLGESSLCCTARWVRQGFRSLWLQSWQNFSKLRLLQHYSAVWLGHGVPWKPWSFHSISIRFGFIMIHPIELKSLKASATKPSVFIIRTGRKTRRAFGVAWRKPTRNSSAKPDKNERNACLQVWRAKSVDYAPSNSTNSICPSQPSVEGIALISSSLQ